MHPSSLRRRCPPPATSGPAAAAWPSYAIEVSRLASLWPRRGLPRSENEPAPDSELRCVFDAPDAARRSPYHPAEPSENHPNIDTTIKWAGGSQKSPSSRGGYGSIRNELQFGRYFSPSAGGLPLRGKNRMCNNILCPEALAMMGGESSPRRGCGYGSRIALQSTFDQSAGSPGTLALLQVRLISGNFLQWKAI